jgi:hypothetical protein
MSVDKFRDGAHGRDTTAINPGLELQRLPFTSSFARMMTFMVSCIVGAFQTTTRKEAIAQGLTNCEYSL